VRGSERKEAEKGGKGGKEGGTSLRWRYAAAMTQQSCEGEAKIKAAQF
jgi:hypothetical protein